MTREDGQDTVLFNNQIERERKREKKEIRSAKQVHTRHHRFERKECFAFLTVLLAVLKGQKS